MQQQASQEQAARAPREEAPTLLEQVPQGEQAPPEEPPVPPVADEGRANDAPPSDGRRTMFVNGEAVRLDADLPSAGIGAGTVGVVTWVILRPPVSYLVEFRSGGESGPPTKVQETYLSPAG